MRVFMGFLIFRSITSFTSAILRLLWAIGIAIGRLVQNLLVPAEEDQLRRMGHQRQGDR